MSQLLYGSIDFSKLLELARAGNKAFTKADNGKIYCNLNVWINDRPDQYGNDASIQTNFKNATKDDRVYFGNMKKSTAGGAEQLEAGDNSIPSEDDLPF